jgi:Fe-S cluster biogenesis protein NfuA
MIEMSPARPAGPFSVLMTTIRGNGGNPMEEKVREALEKVRPHLQRDGGDVELVEITEDGIVKVRLQGACAGCPMAQMTLQMGIEQTLKEMVPEVKAVQGVA